MNQNNIKPRELLTGKAKEHYHRWLEKNGFPLIIWSLDDDYIEKDYPLIYALIIDWLDSVGIYVQLEVFDSCISYSIKDFKSTILYDCYMSFDTRHQATQEAIKKAVEIFNNKP